MSVLSDAIKALITERITSKGVTKLTGDEGEINFEDAESLTKALLNLSKLESMENKKRLIKPQVTKLINPEDSTSCPTCGPTCNCGKCC